MFRKSRYGTTTATDCFFCKEKATGKNKQGFSVCIHHKTALDDGICPICKNFMEAKDGRFGAYFYCFECGRNWSAYQMKKYKKM